MTILTIRQISRLLPLRRAMFRPLRNNLVLCGLCLLALFLPCACFSAGAASKGTAARPVNPAVPNAALPYTPQEEAGVFLLGAEEVMPLVTRLLPANQGLKSWRDMDFALAQSLDFASSRSASAVALKRGDLNVTWGDLCRSLELMRELLPRLDANPALLAQHFRWYRLGPDIDFTGYYEPTLRASRTRTERFNYPLYRVPRDLRRGKAYHSRNAIDRKNALAGRGLEIAWVESEVDAYFLHVQGSGRLLFPDGKVTHVLYAGKNNRGYVSIGRLMREDGLLPEDGVNMEAIKCWLAENPEKCAPMLDRNPSYVFFKEAQSGPIGGMGKVLTPWVSVAVHPKRLPYGSLFFASVPLPDENPKNDRYFNGLVLAQDAGGAIKGNRMDLFCGAGEKAAHVAGHLDAKGAVYLLLPVKK